MLRLFFILTCLTLISSCDNSNKILNDPSIPPGIETTEFNNCPNNAPNQHEGLTLVWVDEFNEILLDESYWNYMYGDGSDYGIPGWGNNEAQRYGDNVNNIYTANGCLFIVPTFNEATEYESARINSSKKQAFHFGRIDVSFSVPEMRGVWPAIWLLPEEWLYGDWPRSGEIDLMETINTKSDELYTTVHFYDNGHKYVGSTTYLDQLTKLTNPVDHNVISLIWNDDSFQWLVNNQLVYELYFDDLNISPNPFLEEFHMLLNVAVGGNWPGQPIAEDYCNSRINCEDVKKLIIDYVAYYREL